MNIKTLFFSLILLALPCGLLMAQPKANTVAKAGTKTVTKTASSVASGKQALINYIESLKNDNDLKDASWSVMVVDCATQKTVASYRAAANLVPASIQKLLTTGAGLLTFGSRYKFTTTLAYSGTIDADSVLQGNLYLIGGGDPTFGSSQFRKTVVDTIFNEFIREIKKTGIRSINGSLIADASLFDDNEIHDTWEWGDIGNYYGSGTSALTFCENTFSITVKPAKEAKQPATIGVPYPTLPDAIIKNYLSTAPKDSTADALIYSSPMMNEYWISGLVPAGRDSVVAKGAIQNPAKVCITALDAFLNKNNVKTLNRIEVKTDTVQLPAITAIVQWQSPAYSEIAENTNRYSNNVFAETILKDIAAKRSKQKQVSYNMGVNYVIRILSEKGINTKNIKLNDGSGLSRQNLISAEFMCQYLMMMNKANPLFAQLLPSAGEKGTLTNFMKDYTANRKNVNMKSGSMTGVLNYAGYVKNKKGEVYCVTVMTNNFTCKVSQMRPKLEKLVYLVTECE